MNKCQFLSTIRINCAIVSQVAITMALLGMLSHGEVHAENLMLDGEVEERFELKDTHKQKGSGSIVGLIQGPLGHNIDLSKLRVRVRKLDLPKQICMEATSFDARYYAKASTKSGKIPRSGEGQFADREFSRFQREISNYYESGQVTALSWEADNVCETKMGKTHYLAVTFGGNLQELQFAVNSSDVGNPGLSLVNKISKVPYKSKCQKRLNNGATYNFVCNVTLTKEDADRGGEFELQIEEWNKSPHAKVVGQAPGRQSSPFRVILAPRYD